MIARRLTLSAAALLAALALAACGSEDGAGNPESEASVEEATAPLTGAPPELAAIREQANQLIEADTAEFERRLDQLRGTPIVVNKWASWCGPCRLEFPFFQSQALDRGDRVAFLGVNSNDSTRAAETFLEELPLPYPSYVDPDSKLAAEIGAPANFPATAFYDSKGERVFTRQGGYDTEEALVADIERYAR